MNPSGDNRNNAPRNPLARHPWLFVVLAFLILIAAWTTFIVLSTGVPNQKLSPAEELRVLETRKAQP